MFTKKKKKKKENFVNLFVNACILGCKAQFGVLVYDTYAWFFFPSILKLHFLVKIENGLMF
jgi:hypothetical protein